MLGPREIWERLNGTDAVPPGTIGRSRGPLLVLGCARNVWLDVQQLGDWPHDVMAINDIGMHYPRPLRHWLTLYPDHLPGWMATRTLRFHGVDGRRPDTHSHRGGNIDRVWLPTIAGGTGGGSAALVGLMLGHDPVILAGVPMDGEGHYYDPPDYRNPGPLSRHLEIWWEQKRPLMEGRVFSLSGRTRAWLGAPPSLSEAA